MSFTRTQILIVIPSEMKVFTSQKTKSREKYPPRVLKLKSLNKDLVTTQVPQGGLGILDFGFGVSKSRNSRKKSTFNNKSEVVTLNIPY